MQLKKVIFEPTYRCNLKCKMCVPFPDGRYRNKEMAYEEIERTFTQSSLLKSLEIVDISGGEPFLRKDMPQIINLLMDMQIKVGVTTNGWFTERIQELIKLAGDKKHNLYISISIDGLGRVHDKIRGTAGSFDRAVKTIELLKENKMPVHVNTVLNKDILADMDAINSYFTRLGAAVTFLPLAVFEKDKFPYSKKETGQIIKYINNPINLKYVVSKGRHKISNCSAASSGCFIGADGTIFACIPTFREINNLDHFVLGNLKKYNYNFDVLFTSNMAEKARENVKKCHGCAKNCEVSREVRFNNFSVDITKKEAMRFKDYLPTEICITRPSFISMISGWYETEHRLIWMKKEACVLLNNKSIENPKLKLTLINGCPEKHGDALRCQIYINGKLQARFSFDYYGEEKSKVIPLDKGFGIYRIQFKWNREWIPDNYLHNGDTRNLGGGILELKIE